MITVAKNVPTIYKAPHEQANVTGVRLVDLRQYRQVFGEPVERIVYEGTEAALADAGLVPPAMFAAVGISGKKSARLLHPDGTQERVRLSRRSAGQWRIKRQSVMASVMT